MEGRIIKHSQETRFTVVPNDLLQRPDISLKAKGMLCYLLSLPADWKIYKTQLETKLIEGREAINSCFDELEKHRYIVKIETTRTAGKFQGFDYLVSSQPITIEENEILQPLRETRKRSNRCGKTVNGKPATTKENVILDTSITTKETLVQNPTFENEKNETKDEAFARFEQWVSKNASRVQKLKEPITPQQLRTLKEKYPLDAITDVLQQMHNKQDLLKKYTSAYLTAENWIKRRLADPKSINPLPSINEKIKNAQKTYSQPQG